MFNYLFFRGISMFFMNCDEFRITLLFKIMHKSNNFAFLVVTFYGSFTNVCSNFVLLLSPYTKLFLKHAKYICVLHWQLTCIFHFSCVYVCIYFCYVFNYFHISAQATAEANSGKRKLGNQVNLSLLFSFSPLLFLSIFLF